MPLSKVHDVESFDCGESVMTDWLKSSARSSNSGGSTAVKVLVDLDDPAEVLGYYALSPTRFVSDSREVSAILLARLAVDLKCRGKQLPDHSTLTFGRFLALRAIEDAVLASGLIGGTAITLVAADAKLFTFYESVGFGLVDPDERTMLLPMKAAAVLLRSANMLPPGPVAPTRSADGSGITTT